MKEVRQKYSNADGDYLDGLSIRTGDEIDLFIDGKFKRKYKVTSLFTNKGFRNVYPAGIILQTCDNGKFKEIILYGRKK